MVSNNISRSPLHLLQWVSAVSSSPAQTVVTWPVPHRAERDYELNEVRARLTI